MDVFHKVEQFYQQVKTEKYIIGHSVFYRPIFAVKIGVGRPMGIAQYAIHGREFITARLAMEQYNIGVKKGSCWFIPLANPDGALLSEIGVDSAPLWAKDSLLTQNGKEDFSLWKSNGRGVDLNVNFDARWGEGVKNVFVAGRENYVGTAPFSEPETQALKRFTEWISPDYTVSYHTKGEEIYWRFFQDENTLERDRKLAEILSKYTGYPCKETSGSVGGYKDWCIQTFHIPSFTVESGKDNATHPLGDRDFLDIYEKNAYALYELSGAMEGIK
ncbi:MAG: hypothetical protein J6D30_04980 [Clostridia bacterium]|nr:hypothetical protein [Clostridia bacterium]